MGGYECEALLPHELDSFCEEFGLKGVRSLFQINLTHLK